MFIILKEGVSIGRRDRKHANIAKRSKPSTGLDLPERKQGPIVRKSQPKVVEWADIGDIGSGQETGESLLGSNFLRLLHRVPKRLCIQVYPQADITVELLVEGAINPIENRSRKSVLLSGLIALNFVIIPTTICND